MSGRLKRIYPILLVLFVFVVSVSLLVTSETVTRAVLESRQDPETLALLQEIFPEAVFYTFDSNTEIYTLYNSGRGEIGYAFYGDSWGYTSTIVVLIGLEDKETIKGIVVTSQRETVAYWKKLEDENFFEQFYGLKVEDCVLKTRLNPEGSVDGVTGATYSAKAVVNAINEGILEKIEYIN